MINNYLSDDDNLVKEALLNQLTKGDYEAFIYDCDGTLADNMDAHKTSYSMAALAFNIDLNAAIIDELSGIPIDDVAAEIKRRYKGNFDHKDLAALKIKFFDEVFVLETKPVPFVVNHLKANAGKVKIAVVSGGERKSIQTTLGLLGLTPLVQALVCAGDTKRGKPFADPYLQVAEQLQVNPEKCLVFEDGQAGTDGAAAAGMQWIRIDQL